MKEFKENSAEVSEEKPNEELFSIENEASCSPEFSKGCIFNKKSEDITPS